jgi:hypothetical protein
MNNALLKRVSANTASWIGPSLALSIVVGIPYHPSEQPLGTDVSVTPTGLIRFAADEPIVRSQWTELLRRADEDDIERDLAPFIPPLRTRPATIHIFHRGRGLPLL